MHGVCIYTGYIAHGNSIVKQEEGADTRIIIVKERYRIWKEGTWAHKGEKSLTRAKDLTIELREGRDFLYHRLKTNLTYSLLYGP